MLRWFVSRGWHGWVLLGVVVIGFDVAATALGGETMTYTVRRWLRHTPTALIVIPVLVYLVAHMTVMPLRFDPLDRSYAWLYKKLHAPPSQERQPPPPRQDFAPGNG